ncbi:hypothetical protein BpHYR1_031379 [Brachionus plicatilis]|uniref:Uncharacterized protein n=1 Tax=Brachionus plicatilis TaxID=10195 RepID=A0A3M7STZ0_BRAPC|nr:hypothetical protein BpHYR1_031379 [Brachionus plicatilis]
MRSLPDNHLNTRFARSKTTALSEFRYCKKNNFLTPPPQRSKKKQKSIFWQKMSAVYPPTPTFLYRF